MTAGVSTTNFDQVSLADEVIVNRDGTTARMGVNLLAAQIASEIPGPRYETRAELYADLAWADKTQGVVWGDATEAYQGLYKKTGASGSGSWARYADLPQSSVTAAQLNAKAPLASPALTGTPTAPTAAPGTNTTQIASTAFVQAAAQAAIDALIAAAPGALNTLSELAVALGNDPNFAATVTGAIATKAPLASAALTGTPTAPTAAPGTNTTQIASTAFVQAAAQAAIDALIAAAPGALNTLNELAAALGDDPNFAATVTAALATHSDGIAAEIARARAAEALISTTQRPGDLAAAYAPQLTGDVAATTAYDTAAVIVDVDLGAAILLAEATHVASRVPMPIEPGRVYQARWAAKRLADPADPIGDAVEIGVRWLTESLNGVAGGSGNRVAETIPLTEAMGAQRRTVTLSIDVEGVDFTIPAAARYGRPWARTYGTDHETVVGRVELTDITESWQAEVAAIAEIANETTARQAAEAVGSLIRLDMDPANTGDVMIATIPAALGPLTPALGQAILFRAPGANTVSPTLQMAGITYELRSMTGEVLPAGALSAGRYIGQIHAQADSPRIRLLAPVTAADLVGLQPALDAKAPLASPELTGTPTAPTAAPGTNTTQLANTAFVRAAIDALIEAAPGALDTLNELAAALGDDPNFAATVTGAIAAKAPLASPALTGTPTAPTAAPGANTTQLANTAFVRAAIDALIAAAPGAMDTLNELAAALGNDANFAATVTGALAAKAPLASPALTGTPTAPTATPGTSNTQLANTAFVQAVSGAVAAVRLVFTAGDGQASAYDIPVAASGTALSVGSVVQMRWPGSNTGADPVATIGGVPYAIRSRSGAALVAGDLTEMVLIGRIYAVDQIRLLSAVQIADIPALASALALKATAADLLAEANARQAVILGGEAGPVEIVDQNGNVALALDEKGIELLGRETISGGGDVALLLETNLGMSVLEADEDGNLLSLGRPVMIHAEAAIEAERARVIDYERSGVYLPPGALLRWRAARGRVLQGTGSALVLCIGDSKTAGGTVEVGLSARARSWPTMLARLFGATAWGGINAGWWGDNGQGVYLDDYDPRIVLGAGWSPLGTEATIGGTLIRNTSTTAALTFAPGFVWDTATVVVEGVVGELTLSDGVTTTSHTIPAGAPVELVLTSATPGARTLSIARVSGETGLAHVRCEDSTLPSVAVVNAGWSGSATTQWLGATEAHSPATLLPGVAAHLVPVALGTNDFNTSQDPDAVFGPNLGLLLDAMPAGADVLLVAAVPPVDDRTWPWSAYVDAMFAIAQARGIAMIDMSRAIGSHAEMLAADMIVDRLHQNTAGSADQAAATFTLLSN